MIVNHRPVSISILFMSPLSLRLSFSIGSVFCLCRAVPRLTTRTWLTCILWRTLMTMLAGWRPSTSIIMGVSFVLDKRLLIDWHWLASVLFLWVAISLQRFLLSLIELWERIFNWSYCNYLIKYLPNRLSQANQTSKRPAFSTSWTVLWPPFSMTRRRSSST